MKLSRKKKQLVEPTRIVVATGPRYIKRVYFQLHSGHIIYEFGWPKVPVELGKGDTLTVEFNGLEFIGVRKHEQNPDSISCFPMSVLFNDHNGRWVAE